ncbi:L,D-transpeptidase family protein [Actinoallomurus sp. NPDC050550]|uniref:L,D-transpeptidase family protein n=1 Tax=Actinoallomurus sp. NPDC050550 TaxID=3154937 RepID=UPI0033D84B63
MRKSLGKAAVIGTLSAMALVPAVAAPASAYAVAATSPVSAQANPTLHFGDKGPAVTRLQQRLAALHYDPGTVDGQYGSQTRFAVWAFQKVQGMHPTQAAPVGTKTWAALAKPRTPKSIVKGGAANRAEVDLTHQLLFIYKGGRLTLISHISSGRAYYYYKGQKVNGRTPTGNYSVYRKAKGWETGPLGKLYKGNYFHGGYAIHGEPDVPLYPASHGCVRTPMHTADIVANLLPIGTRVYLRGHAPS